MLVDENEILGYVEISSKKKGFSIGRSIEFAPGRNESEGGALQYPFFRISSRNPAYSFDESIADVGCGEVRAFFENGFGVFAEFERDYGFSLGFQNVRTVFEPEFETFRRRADGSRERRFPDDLPSLLEIGRAVEVGAEEFRREPLADDSRNQRHAFEMSRKDGARAVDRKRPILVGDEDVAQDRIGSDGFGYGGSDALAQGREGRWDFFCRGFAYSDGRRQIME